MSPLPSPRAAGSLTVIVPAFDEAASIGPLLNDLAWLHAAGAELIVVDGGSRDATREIAQRFADRVLLAEKGRAQQMNAGAAAARGDLLWFVHADCRIPRDAPGQLLTALQRGARWGRFDVTLSGRHPMFVPIAALMNLRSRLTGIATGDQGIFVERQLFETVGGFPAIALMEDIALSKLLRREQRPACLRKPRLITSSRRWEQRGVWPTVLLMWRLRLAYALGAQPSTLAKLYR